MSEQSPYEQLGVGEDASFEEIQAAKQRLFEQYKDDKQQLQLVETAYDAVLMERLRMRQEGKIKVPDRIRFPEKLTPTSTSSPISPLSNAPNWVQRFIDTPSQNDILLPAGILASLSALVVLIPSSAALLQLVWVLGMGSTFYFIYRKEQKLGRAILLGVVGAVIGSFLGSTLGNALSGQLAALKLQFEAFATIITFTVLWGISAFLR